MKKSNKIQSQLEHKMATNLLLVIFCPRRSKFISAYVSQVLLKKNQCQYIFKKLKKKNLNCVNERERDRGTNEKCKCDHFYFLFFFVAKFYVSMQKDKNYGWKLFLFF